jgi:hypothetical protein
MAASTFLSRTVKKATEITINIIVTAYMAAKKNVVYELIKKL